jgi:hypothetical protein
MNLASQALQRFLKLDPPLTRDIMVQHDLRVPMPDGVELLADRWAPPIWPLPATRALLDMRYEDHPESLLVDLAGDFGNDSAVVRSDLNEDRGASVRRDGSNYVCGTRYSGRNS